MTLPTYLAMTNTEIQNCSALPTHVAYMACHFSPYGTGLCDLPADLPADSMLIINDRISVCHHDPEEILAQLKLLLEEITVSAILLDLQQPNCQPSFSIAKTLVEKLPLPVGVSYHYAQSLDCPVFLDAPMLHVPLSEHLKPWQGRQVWLDAAIDARRYRVDKSGCTQIPCIPSVAPLHHHDEQLHCHYQIRQESDHVTFTLQRTAEDIQALLSEGQDLGVTMAIGLYQEWGVFHKKVYSTPKHAIIP